MGKQQEDLALELFGLEDPDQEHTTVDVSFERRYRHPNRDDIIRQYRTQVKEKSRKYLEVLKCELYSLL